MLQAVWKTISLFMALAAFLVVGAGALMAGEDILWTSAKAVGSFAACWIVMGYLGNALRSVVERQDASGLDTKNGEA